MDAKLQFFIHLLHHYICSTPHPLLMLELVGNYHSTSGMSNNDVAIIHEEDRSTEKRIVFF